MPFVLKINPFLLPKNQIIGCLYQNAVHSFLANPTAKQYDKPILCVGEKTKSLLEENGRKVKQPKIFKNWLFL